MIYVAGGGMRTGSVAMFQIMREIVSSSLTGYAPVLPVGQEDMHFIDHAEEWSLDPMKIVVKLHLYHPATLPKTQGEPNECQDYQRQRNS